ncbi:putative reverse transcriptase domain-containing protein [Tanacetum coccineum]
MVVATKPSTIQKAVQIAGTLTDEAFRNGSIKNNPKKRGNGGETSKDRNRREDNKRTRARNAFETTTNPVRRENTSVVPKCTTCNFHHPPETPFRTCFNCNHPGNFAKDCRVVPRNVESGSEARGNHQNQVVAVNGGQGHGNNDNQARGGAFMLGAEEARQDPNIMTVNREERPERVENETSKSAKTKAARKQEEIVVIRDYPEVFLVRTIRLPPIGGKSNIGEEQERAFQTLKDKLCNAPVLALPDGPEDFVVYCDTSGLGLGLRKGLDEMIERRSDGALYYLDQIWVPLKGDVRTLIMDEAHKLKYSDYKMDRLARIYLNKIVARHGVQISIISDRDSVHLSRLRFYVCAVPDGKRQYREVSLIDYVAEAGEGQLVGPELLQETTKKISQIKDRLKAARVVRFGKKGKLAPRFLGPFAIIEKVGLVAYRLDLPEELEGVHDMFHVSNLKKCLAVLTLQVPLDKIQVNDKLNFMEEPVEILEREFNNHKGIRIAIIKVWWNSKRGPEFTWERKDQMKLKYLHLFSSVSR